MPIPLVRSVAHADPHPPDAPAEASTPETVDVVVSGGTRTSRAVRDEQFTAFMAAHQGHLLHTAWLLTGDAHRAEELVQQALVRTYSSWDRVATDRLAYTRRTLVNLRVDTWRRRRREVLTSELPERGIADAHGPTDDRDQLVRALALLSPRQRRVVVLRHLVGLPEAEVAAELGVSLGTVKSTASRGLQRLRETLAETDPNGVVP
ncbi:SigE family RNA polymerase sigma factor [Cellulomonas sp. PhB150]|uniref:SigE family RNA polymerase sigma factor n=1 Tax=Cellulomonas sp. PhB150 TaxID=2485188 RepID=UPI000F472FDA|nr:SigE family RNA polymerase sigma factor [Cellulomonas sp. PhB150]ROS31015.1 RNA polymerase sigma-70 factor (sigma-E family) [Cellulomonas sp. PhB150]